MEQENPLTGLRECEGYSRRAEAKSVGKVQQTMLVCFHVYIMYNYIYINYITISTGTGEKLHCPLKEVLECFHSTLLGLGDRRSLVSSHKRPEVPSSSACAGCPPTADEESFSIGGSQEMGSQGRPDGASSNGFNAEGRDVRMRWTRDLPSKGIGVKELGAGSAVSDQKK